MKVMVKAVFAALALIGVVSAIKNKKTGKKTGKNIDHAIEKAGKYFEHAAYQIRKSGKHHNAQKVGKVIDQAVTRAKSELEKSSGKVRKHAMSMAR